MWIPESAVKTLVEDISEIIKYKPHLIAADVWENLEELKTQLEKLRQLMPNFFNIDGHDGRLDIKETVEEITGILKRCKDAVDYVYSSCSCRTHRSIWDQIFLTDTKSRRNQISKAKRQIQEAGEGVKFINEKIMRKGYQVVPSDQAIVNPDSFQNFSMDGEERVIGLDGAAANVVGLLTTGTEHLKVIPIVGMLGIGKTTLAKMVYNDHEVKSQYKIRTFVYNTSEYGTREVLLKILSSLTFTMDEVNRKMDEHRLQEHVRQQLKGKQYLIVLSDILVNGDLDRLRGAFPNNRGKRCRLLITTRNHNLAKYVNADPDSIYWMCLLSPESSQELLRWRVFGENDCPEKFQVYERDIVRKSHGLPSILVYVAAMLMKHRDRVEWWKKKADTMRDYFPSIAKHSSTILLAYMQLPNHLKPCLLYFSVFPPGYEIPIWKLLRFWIAEGLILQEEIRSLHLEDMAEQYLEELVHRNFVMVSKRRSNGKIGLCLLTDVVYEFCKNEAKNENHFLRRRHQRYRLDSILGDHSRVGINADMLYFLSTNPITGKGIRSFLMFSQAETVESGSTLKWITKSFKLLKVLEAESIFFISLPVQLWSLVLLKYLAIHGNIESLPPTLSDLWSLQTLIVNTTYPTLRIEADIWEMPHFRHLHTNAAATFTCQIASNDESRLQTLCYISPECCKKEVFHRARKLRKLGISGTLSELFEVRGQSSLVEYLQNLENLENLKLLNHSKFKSLLCLPPKISLPKQLTNLTLSNTRLDWKEMRTLGEMENLEILKLKERAFVGEEWKTENGGFLRLRHLHIGHMDLMVWEALADHFPTLRSLEIRGCNQLRRIPCSLADILSLQSVRLHNSTSPGLTYSIKRMRLVKFLQTNRKNFEISVYPPQE